MWDKGLLRSQQSHSVTASCRAGPGAEAHAIANFNELRAESLAIDRARAQKSCVAAKPSPNL